MDPTTTYREMGLLTDNGPLGFIGSTRVLAGPSRDSLLVVLALSLQARGLTFRRDSDGFLAEYRVEVVLRGPGQAPAMSGRNERVVVATFRETQRIDETIIYQDIITVAPGSYALTVTVRDRNGPNVGRVEQAFTVPALITPSVSLPLAVYQAELRQSLAGPPTLVTNPRQAVQYGGDTLLFYFETYGMAPGSRLVATATDGSGRTGWLDTIAVADSGPVTGRVLAIPPARLSIGRYELRLIQGSTVMAAAPFVVTFSEQYAVANVEDIVSLLRYFPGVDSVRAILRLPVEERGAAWQRFWRNSDLTPQTPENEAIEEYLNRIRVANDRFRDEGIAGWLTERGEVLIRLGEPDDIVEGRPDQGRGRTILWQFLEYRLTLAFVDDAGFGRYRLTPGARAEFLRVVNRISGR